MSGQRINSCIEGDPVPSDLQRIWSKGSSQRIPVTRIQCALLRPTVTEEQPSQRGFNHLDSCFFGESIETTFKTMIMREIQSEVDAE